MSVTPEQRLKLLYEPCSSKEELHQHIKSFLKIDVPNHTVDEDSTSNPMEFLWSVYHTMLTGKGPQRVVVAAARNSMKTLGASIIRFYSMIHFRRTGTHLAATMDQSQTLLMYLDRFLMIDGVKEYIAASNTRMKELANLPENGFTKNKTCILRIAVATKKGVNSQRGSFNTRDETELIPKEIIQESSFISDPTQDEHRFGPIELDLSSRKLSDGIMQDKIDEAEGDNPPANLRLHKWSMVDFMRKCPDEIHRPDLPKVNTYMNIETLETIWSQEEYDGLGSGVQSQYKAISAFEGCKTCPAFIACQGRASKQEGSSIGLRDINFVGMVLSSVKDPDTIIAQALNWRPGRSGNVFKMIRKNKHLLKPIQFYKWCFGQYWLPNGTTTDDFVKAVAADELWRFSPSKAEIYKAFMENGWNITYGVDWGYSPARATCIVTAYHKRFQKAAVLHVESAQNLANQDWANHIAKNIWTKYPGDFICPDMADPASPSYFARHSIRSLDTKPSRIDTGVSQIRSLLFDPVAQTERFVILDEGEDNLKLYNAMFKWTHRKSPLGFDYDKYEDDDHCDYCFVPGTTVITSKGATPIEDIKEGDSVLTHTGKYRRVYATMKRHFSGELVSLKVAGRERLLVTPEHRILSGSLKRSHNIANGKKRTGQLSFQEDGDWRSAQDLTKTEKNTSNRDVVFFNSGSYDDNTSGRSPDMIFDMLDFFPNCNHDDFQVKIPRPRRKWKSVPRFVKIDKDFAFLVGYWAAEGSCSQNVTGSRKRAVQFSCHKNEVGVKDILGRVSAMFEGNRPNIQYTGGNGAMVAINSTSLWSIFKPLGKSTNKQLPDWTIDLSMEQGWWLFLGYMFGDGCFTGRAASYNSISKSIAYSIMTLSSKLGLRPSMRYISRKNIKNSQPQYVVSFCATDTNKIIEEILKHQDLSNLFAAKKIRPSRKMQDSSKIFNIDIGTAHIVMKNDRVPYEGLVYNLAVEDDESYTANGIAVHNCDPTRYALDPYVELFRIGINVATKPAEASIETLVAQKDPEALAMVAQKSELMSQVAEHFKGEHGLENIFQTQSKMIKQPDSDAPKRPGSGVKFKF